MKIPLQPGFLKKSHIIKIPLQPDLKHKLQVPVEWNGFPPPTHTHLKVDSCLHSNSIA